MIDKAIRHIYPAATGWSCDGTYDSIIWTDQNFTKPTREQIDAAIVTVSAAVAAEATRTQAIDQSIANDSTIHSLKAMTNSELDSWWSANITNAAQAIAVLKRIARVVLRRVL